MSEPVSNSEIEDVLSSIRRLVSENAGAIKRGDDEAEQQDKLVLTPAFRVDEDDGEDDAAAEAEVDADAEVVAFDSERWAPEDPEAALDEAPPVGDAVAEAAEAVDAPEAADARDVADDLPEAEGEHGDDDWAQAADAEAEAVGEPDVEPEAQAEPDQPVDTDQDDVGLDEPAPDSGDAVDAVSVAPPATGHPARSLESRVAELEAAIDNSGVEWEPDGSEPVSMPDNFVFHHTPGHEAAADPVSEPDVELDSEQEPQPAPEAEAGADAATDAGPEPNAEPAPDEAEAWEDVALAEAPVGPQPEPYSEADGESDAYDDDMTDVIDEDMLREMVARMVRDELQGTVGERITRNIRRMVRREIARALSLQEFE